MSPLWRDDGVEGGTPGFESGLALPRVVETRKSLCIHEGP